MRVTLSVMPARPHSARSPFIAAGILLVIYLIQGLWASAQKSPTFDETGDIAAGLSYLQTGAVVANIQHPPLMKELAGAP